MGLFKAPQTGIALFGPKMRWAQPTMYQARLKGRAGSVLSMMAVCSVGGSILLGVISIIANKPGFTAGGAFFFGFLFGTFLGLLIFAQDMFGGRVRVDKRGIHRSQVAKFPSNLMYYHVVEYEDWPYGAIDKCCIYPGKTLKHGMSILEVYTVDGRDRIGISKLVDIAKLAKFLQTHGVVVSFPKGYVAHQPTMVDRMMQYWVIPVVLGVFFVVAIVAGKAGSSSTEKGDQEAGTSLAGPTMPNLPSSAREDAIRSAEEASRRALETQFPKTEPTGPVEDPFGGTTANGSTRPEHSPMIPDDLPLRPSGSRLGPGRIGGPHLPRGGRMGGPPMQGGPSSRGGSPYPTGRPNDPFE